MEYIPKKGKGELEMWEIIEIILISCAGILIGATFGYVWGFDLGYKQGYEWHKKEELIEAKWGVRKC